MCLKSRGALGASRYKLAPVKADEGEYPTYLAIYEFESKEAMDGFSESPELAAAVEDFENTKGEVGFQIKWAARYELIKSWKR